MSIRKLAKSVLDKISYEIELVTQLITVIIAGGIYGVIEATWIPTDKLSLPICGMWSWYHVWLMLLMLTVSFSLALSHVQSFIDHKKKYILLMCVAALPVALMIEDIAWFITRKQPIARDEWTMMKPGLGLNIGFTYVPLWYFIVMAFAITMYSIANHFANKGYSLRK